LETSVISLEYFALKLWDVEEKLDASCTYVSAVVGKEERVRVSLSPGKEPLPLAVLVQTGCDMLAGFITFLNFLRFAVQ
jgi:hypothetical protein